MGKRNANPGEQQLHRLLADIRACRICRDAPTGARLGHEPRPVIRASTLARIIITGQAPGVRVHASGTPFTDPSGDRLRDWLGITPDVFYDESRIAIVPMGFCFPGLDAAGGDRPPRAECARRWRQPVLGALPNAELIVLVGGYAQRWHLGLRARNMTATVEAWREIHAGSDTPRLFPLPHPSWRNNAWLKANPWFHAELLPDLRLEVQRLLHRDLKK